MLRRFVSGLVWGGVVAGLGLAVVSQVAPRPVAPMAPPAEDVAAAEPDATPQAPAMSEAEKPLVDAGAPDTTDATVTETGTAKKTEPETETAASAEITTSGAADPSPVTAPGVGAETGAAPLAEAAAAPNTDTLPAEPAPEPQTETPAAPAAVAETADTTTEVPKPAEPKADAPATVVAPAEVIAPAQIAADSMAPDDLVTPDQAADSAAQDLQPVTPPRIAADEPLLSPAPKAGDAPSVIEPAPPPTAVVQDLPRLLTPESDPGPPGKLALSLPEAQPGSSSLPQIGEAPAAAVAEAPLPEAAVIDDLPPIAAFARPFDNADGKPLFAILLVDDGSASLDRATLAALPFPVTFVVDPQAPNAAEAAAIYRAGLQEVVMSATGLPEGAEAADIEQSFQANAAILPETVAVIDTGPEGRLEDRDTAAALVPILQDQGRGLITYDVGLNAADQAARRAALPTVALFRVLDADSESQPTIRRYLDRAAFKAAQEGKVVVMGSTRPETVAAILEWTVEGRAASVALAPVTAVLSAP